MMRRRVVIPAFTLFAAVGALPSVAVAQFSDPTPPGRPMPLPADAEQRFTAQQLDNLAGPVALYPDALLAQVLVAATFPDQVEDAAAFVRAYGTDSVDVQNWDVSVKAVAHYPSALNAMADKIDWTTALGRAYATQSSDVMNAVQRLRRMAADQGNLNTTPQQKVITNNDTYQIVPVQERVVYVPVYDPIVYTRPIFTMGSAGRYWSWGIGFPIGSWLIYDCDWGFRRIYYNGWSPSFYAFGGGWRQRSRPFIQVTNVYINPRYTNVYVNRTVINRSVNYYNVDRYVSVHNGRHFDNRRDGRYDSRDDGRNGQRYAVLRNDGNNRGGSAVRGGGYSAPDQNVRNNPPRDGSGYGNGPRGGDRNNGNDRGDRSNGNDRGGYSNGDNSGGNGGYNAGGDRGDRGNGGPNRGGDNRGGDNRGGDYRGSGRDDSPRDGNGNRIGNPSARPPEQRRPEPSYVPGVTLNVPERRAEPRSEPRSAPRNEPRNTPERAAPAPDNRGRQPERQSAPRAAPSERRSEPAPSVRSAPAGSSEKRSAVRRGN